MNLSERTELTGERPGVTGKGETREGPWEDKTVCQQTDDTKNLYTSNTIVGKPKLVVDKQLL